MFHCRKKNTECTNQFRVEIEWVALLLFVSFLFEIGVIHSSSHSAAASRSSIALMDALNRATCLDEFNNIIFVDCIRDAHAKFDKIPNFPSSRCTDAGISRGCQSLPFHRHSSIAYKTVYQAHAIRNPLSVPRLVRFENSARGTKAGHVTCQTSKGINAVTFVLSWDKQC